MPPRGSSLAFVEWNKEIREMSGALVRASWKCESITVRLSRVQRGAMIVILLCAGHKRTQTRDIRRAQAMARAIAEKQE